MNSLGMESPSFNRSYSSSYSAPSGTPVNRSISRVPLQPPTPVIVPPSPSPLSSPAVPNSVNCGRMLGGGNSAGSSPVVPKNVTASPSIPAKDLPAGSAEEAERQTNRRSMYRAPGTSSSPDLATLLRKAKERGGTVTPTVGALGRRDKRREEPPPLPDNCNVVRHAPVSYNAGESSRNLPSSSPNKLRDGTVKVCLFFSLYRFLSRYPSILPGTEILRQSKN